MLETNLQEIDNKKVKDDTIFNIEEELDDDDSYLIDIDDYINDYDDNQDDIIKADLTIEEVRIILNKLYGKK